MNQSTLLIYVGTLWRDAENGSDGPYVTDAPIPPYCIPDEGVSFDTTPEDVDFPWIGDYVDVWDTQVKEEHQ